MRVDYQCEECKNTTRSDEFSCACLCINCGPCNVDGCKHEDNMDANIPNSLDDN